jgi:hypothetical protein
LPGSFGSLRKPWRSRSGAARRRPRVEDPDGVREDRLLARRCEPPRAIVREPGNRQPRKEQATRISGRHGLAYPVLRNFASG